MSPVEDPELTVEAMLGLVNETREVYQCDYQRNGSK